MYNTSFRSGIIHPHLFSAQSSLAKLNISYKLELFSIPNN